MELFKNTLKTQDKATPETVVDFKFEFNEGITEDQIEYMRVDCTGCTKARIEDGAVVGTLDLSKAQQYNDGETVVNRGIRVFLNDGQNEFIADPVTKMAKPNPEKKFQRLTVVSVVRKN